MNLSTPISDAGRLYNMYASRLEKLDIYTLRDFLFHLPSRYDDYSFITPIASAQSGEVVTIKGHVTEIKNDYTRSRKQLQKATVADETGSIHVIWFNQPYIAKTLKFGDQVALSGRVDENNFQLVLNSPDFEVIPENGVTIHTGRLVPIYPETQGVSSKWLRRQVYKLLQNNAELEEFLPEDIKKSLNLMELGEALYQVHFPETLENATKAKERLAFDEVLLLQLGSLQRKNEWRKNLHGHIFEVERFQKQIDAFWQQLPFEPTNAQRRAIHEILSDVSTDKPMNRLLEGDVGSGKTVVAAIAMYVAFLNGFQSVLMAPTEILANQHYKTIKTILEPLGVKVDLRTGSKKSIKGPVLSIKGNDSLNTLYSPLNTNIIVGTHAVLSEAVNFDKLGLVVIDEQQRFGVEQRSLIRSKGDNPHVLTMTATPIPRTVALTLYGDLDLSILDEMPKGRQIIKTWLVPEVKRKGGYEWIDKKIAEGDQVFIVCPFIEESENMTTVKAATAEFERLKAIFPHRKLGLLHGKQRGKDKDEVLLEFKNQKIDILVATPVVEVGIDIPNATIMLIEAAERFGLAQLHQLRGRVGRGAKQSYCLLFTDSKTPQTIQRLKSLEHIHSGPELAELDLQFRGAGELYGTLQHGRRWLKIASFSDLPLIQKAKHGASTIFPKLQQYPKLLEKVQEATLKQVSPD